MTVEQYEVLSELGFDPAEYADMSDEEIADFLEVVQQEPLLAVSICCGAEINDGFCAECGEHA